MSAYLLVSDGGIGGPLFERCDAVRRALAASSSIAMRAAMSSFQAGEPARFGLWRATHGHSQGLQPSSSFSSACSSYHRSHPAHILRFQYSGGGGGQVQRSLPMATNKSTARAVICATGGRAIAFGRAPPHPPPPPQAGPPPSRARVGGSRGGARPFAPPRPGGRPPHPHIV